MIHLTPSFRKKLSWPAWIGAGGAAFFLALGSVSLLDEGASARFERSPSSNQASAKLRECGRAAGALSGTGILQVSSIGLIVPATRAGHPGLYVLRDDGHDVFHRLASDQRGPHALKTVNSAGETILIDFESRGSMPSHLVTNQMQRALPSEDGREVMALADPILDGAPDRALRSALIAHLAQAPAAEYAELEDGLAWEPEGAPRTAFTQIRHETESRLERAFGACEAVGDPAIAKAVATGRSRMAKLDAELGRQ